MTAVLLAGAPVAACLTPSSCVQAVADTYAGAATELLRREAGEAVTTLFSWWTTTASTPVDTAVVRTAQQFATVWVAVPVAVLAVLAVIAWTVGTGSPAWIRDIARGLIVFGVTAAGSIPIVGALQRWMDSLSAPLMDAVPKSGIGRLFIDGLSLPGVDGLKVLFWSLVVFLLGVVQYVLALFRDGAVVILTVVLPIAAAGQFARGSLLWLPKVTGWLLAFLAFKPAAALIYFVGFSLVGQAHGVQAIASGVCVMLAATLALPALLRLVTFAVSSPYPGGTALSGIATTTGIGASIVQVAGRRGGVPAGAATGSGSASGAAAAPSGAGTAATAAVGAASAARNAVSRSVTPRGGNP